MARPFRFGVQVSNTTDAKSWADLARKAEDLGFSTLLMPDHFGEQFAPMVGLMAAADATTDLRVGALVLDNDYKHPVVTAKELATFDVLTGGRTEIGLGAGWMLDDYEKSGIVYDPPKVRIDRMEEGLAIIKGLLADGPVDFKGEHYTITGMEGLPKPVQKPRPPILIGGGGKRLLSIAAREADIVGLTANARSGKVDQETAADAVGTSFDNKIEWVKAAAGERFDDLEINTLLFLVNETDDANGFAETMAPAFGLSTEDMFDVPLGLFGTIDQMCETLEARRERWCISYVICQAAAMDTMAPIVAKLAGT